MKKWMALTVLILGLSVMALGVVRPERAEAYVSYVHSLVCKYPMDLWWYEPWMAEIKQYRDDINRGAAPTDPEEESHAEDQLDHVWGHWGANAECVTISHFWDPDYGINEAQSENWFCPRENHNAMRKAIRLWGMALGQYHKGNKGRAYHYLGHVAHLLADMTVPAHVHDDTHVLADQFDDTFMNQEGTCEDDPTHPECLTSDEFFAIRAKGPLEIPDVGLTPLYWLFYNTAQRAGYYASEDSTGNTDVYPSQPVDFSDLEYRPECCDYLLDPPTLFNQCDMWVIRDNSYLRSIPAVAALYKLFVEETKKPALTVVIDRVLELECHDGDPLNILPCLSAPEYYVKVTISGQTFMNRGEYHLDTADISPGWAFAYNVELEGEVVVRIELWDQDDPFNINGDDQSDIYTEESGDEKAVLVGVNVASCIAGGADAVHGNVVGACGAQLTSAGDDSTNSSQIWFRILAPNVAPTANAGPDQTVHEADLVTLNGSFTDNAGDTDTFLWHLVSSTNGQAVDDATTQSLSFTPVDDGVYTFSFTVTDSYGAQGSDTVVVTAENVPPVSIIGSITDETGAEIGVDVPVALVGLEIDLAGTFTDVGKLDTHTAVIIWGDGNTDTIANFNAFSDCVGGVTGTLNATHIYAAPAIYTIMLQVTDDDAGVGTTTAQIKVVDAAGAISEVVESLIPLEDNKHIKKAIEKLQGEHEGDAKNGAIDKLEKGDLNAALEKIKQALLYLEAAEATDPGLDLTYYKGLLALAAKSVAVIAIAEAEAVVFKPNDLLKIQQAKNLAAQGDALLAAHNYVGAVDRYQQAVREVQNIH